MAPVQNKQFVYLAGPYSAVGFVQDSADAKWLRNFRFIELNKKAAKLMEEGYLVFSPISHSHPIEADGMPKIMSGDWWLRQDFAVLKHVDKVIVYMLPGWEESYGVKKEVEYASDHSIPIEYHKCPDYINGGMD